MTYTISENWAHNRKLDVALVGAGGTGSAMLNKLFQMNQLLTMLNMPTLNISVFDPDIVSQPNIGRQAFWQADLGLKKSDVLVSRFNAFGGTNMVSLPYAFEADELMNKHFDLVVTCTDSVTLRQELGEFADTYYTEDTDSPILWLDTGNGSHTGQCVLGTLVQGDDTLILPCVLELYPELLNMKETATPSCSTYEAVQKQSFGINESMAINGSTLIWQLLKEQSITRHGSQIDILSGYTTPIAINEKTWKMMGLKTSRPILKLLNEQEALIRQCA